MSKQTKTTAAKSGNQNNRATATAAQTAIRLDCWREGIRKALAQYRSADAYGKRITPFELIEDIEGRDIAAVILDHLKAERGLTDNPTAESKAAFRYDAIVEEIETPRGIKEHFTQQGESAVFLATLNPTALTGEDLAAFVRHFFHKGDTGLTAATTRALKAAITFAA